jgi:NAD(P)-dependent dehydrogenase (short-subunit alcohol dehydrogenase family)
MSSGPQRGTITVLESVALEVASFGFGITIIKPGGARTEFHDGGARVAKLMPIYHHSFLRMVDPKNGLAPGEQERMAARIIGSVDLARAVAPHAPVTGIGMFTEDPVQTDASFEGQTERAASRYFPPEELTSTAFSLPDTTTCRSK